MHVIRLWYFQNVQVLILCNIGQEEEKTLNRTFE